MIARQLPNGLNLKFREQIGRKDRALRVRLSEYEERFESHRNV